MRDDTELADSLFRGGDLQNDSDVREIARLYPVLVAFNRTDRELMQRKQIFSLADPAQHGIILEGGSK